MKINFRTTEPIDAALAERAGQLSAVLAGSRGPGRPASTDYNLVARRDLERYYAMLWLEARGLNFSVGEAALVCDANNGTLWDQAELTAQPTMLWANVADGIRLGGVSNHGLTEQQEAELISKLQRLTPGQCLAVVDAVERFWHSPRLNELDTEDLLREVGLIQ
ncbi:MAG: hypothetical protein AB7S38_29110 [Vulcanimicrobiota bacterium]